MDAKVKLMEARHEAAELRLRAASQMEQAARYRRQANTPIYDGQAEICRSKAEQVEALAAKNRAKADLIEAQAEAAYRAASGQEPPTKE